MTRAEQIIQAAIDEDIGSGDITTDSIIDNSLFASAVIKTKEDAIIAGIKTAELVFYIVDPLIKFKGLVKDGEFANKDKIIVSLTGKASSMLKAERTAINFLMRLSGIATLTNTYIKAMESEGVTLLDTRKTTPGLRMLEKQAVKAGGGTNHRFGLFDGVLIKDNHIKSVGSVGEAVKKMKHARPYQKTEVEVKTIEELKEAIAADADIVMLDNMDLKMLKQAIDMAKGKAIIEVSGNITPDSIKAVALLKPDFISAGAITHSAKAIDICMKLTNIYTKEMV